ncbi:MAG: hypothetical protein ACRERE_42435 [Candidatus Entotheonellia bacterium]
MRGEKVIVRAFGGEPLVRLIWDVYPDAIDICDEGGYQRLLTGESWIPIGFPRRDVFRYDPGVIERLTREWRVNPSVWESLTVWLDDVEVKQEQQ